MTKWRPEKWNKTRLELFNAHVNDSAFKMDIGLFEAGADAMLEALREAGQNISNPYSFQIQVIACISIREKGTLIFIPDEEAR